MLKITGKILIFVHKIQIGMIIILLQCNHDLSKTKNLKWTLTFLFISNLFYICFKYNNFILIT